MARHVVLLRGMNIGARRMRMADLRAALEAAGHGDVRTLLQSGNVVLDADATGDELRRELEATISAAAGFACPVVLRTREELGAVLAANPLAGVADDPRRHQVTFLDRAPDPAVAAELHALDVAPEAVVVVGRELHAWHPDGIGRSPLAERLARLALPDVTATSRNWATVTKLAALADG
jgi:uncharacterized protein (DUF1697 family)